jgi:hypothetical protein
VLLSVKRRSLGFNLRHTLVDLSNALKSHTARRSAILAINGNNLVAVYFDLWFSVFVFCVHISFLNRFQF